MSCAKETFLINRHFGDLNPIVHGSEACLPGHTFGPAIRPYTLLHYVVSGTGSYTVHGETYRVSAGEVFRILPGEVTVYSADLADPWTYRWIGFDGGLSERFSELPPVFPLDEEHAGVFLRDLNGEGMREYLLAAELFRLYSVLFTGESGRTAHYVRRVKDYVRAMYMQEVRVERIAEQMNLDRRYLSRVFKEKTGKSVQEYIISVRMEEAARSLLCGHTVAEAARLSGYEDACNFSKIFKSRYGVSPSLWRERSLSHENTGKPPKNSEKIENFFEKSADST